MNKLFVILALLAFMPAEARAESYVDDNGAFVLAKAVKLGRGKAYSITNNSNWGGGRGTIDPDKNCDQHCADCDKSTGTCNSCASGYYLKNGACVSCPANATCNNGLSFICKDYYYKFGDSCQAICSGVTCKSGYKTAAAAEKCCCEKDNGCSANQVYNSTIKKCVAQTCPTGCADMCPSGCGSCVAGRYLDYNDGTCPLCSSAIANCDTCTSSALGPSCTKCKSGYLLSSGACAACPSNATCDGTSSFTCNSGYTKLGNTCNKTAITCPANCSTCSSSSTCTKCNSGYYLSSGKCVSCPLNATCSGTSSFSCKSGYERYNNTCRTSSCDGISSTPKWCQDGYTRVVGKGCCPPGVDTNKVGACMLCRTTQEESLITPDCSSCDCGPGYVAKTVRNTCSCEWDGVTLPAKTAKACDKFF